MYIRTIRLSNIRSIAELRWGLGTNRAPGWHVVIGDNGSGKSTFLRAIALALVGPSEAIALRQDWNDWLRSNTSQGEISIWLTYSSTYDKFSGKGRSPELSYLRAGLRFSRQEKDIELKGIR